MLDWIKRITLGELVIVMTIMGIGALSMSILQPMLPLYLDHIGVAPAVLGLMFSVAMVGMVIGESSWGWVADKIGLRVPLLVGTAACGAVVLSFLSTQNVPVLFTIFFVWGVLRSAIYGPGRGYIGANAPPAKKSTYMAIVAAMLAASRSLGALPGGFIVDTLGYNWIFIISCGIAVFGGLVVIVGLRATRQAKPGMLDVKSPATDGPSSSVRAPIYRTFGVQCAVAALEFFAVGTLMTFMPLFATQVVGISATQVGLIFTVGGLIAMVAGIPMGMLADRRGKRTFMILGLLISTAAMVGIALTQSLPWLFTFGVILSVGMATFSPAALGLLSDSIPRQRQSTAMGIYGGVCENSGVIAGSAFGGLIWTAWGPQATFIAAAIASGLGALICTTLVKVIPAGVSQSSSTDCDCC
jgi:MFS family permease